MLSPFLALRRGALLAVALLLVWIAAPTDLLAQEHDGRFHRVLSRIPFESVHSHWQDCGLRRVEMEGQVIKRHAGPVPKSDATASIVVDYGSGFTTEAREAFQRAVDVWERHIRSDVEIRIEASFEDLGRNVLGGARSNFVYGVDFDGDGAEDTIFLDALIDALANEDQSPGEPDIIAQFSSSRTDWHFGEEPAPGFAIDFTTVVLHEIGHGLNYFDFLNYSDGRGSYGIDFNQNGRLDPEEQYAGIFDQFLVAQTPSGRVPVTNTDVFPVGSTELGDALTGGQLFFDGSNARLTAERSTGPIPPKVYAPSPFAPGSSIAHLDEVIYPPGDINSLMSPSVGAGETTRMPGPIVCGQFQDMGWTLGAFCNQYLNNVFAVEAFLVAETPGAVTVSWNVARDASIQTFVVEEQRFDGSFQEVARLDGSAPSSVTLTDRPLGRYTYRIRWIEDGSSEQKTTVQQPEVTLNVSNFTVDVSEPNERGVATASVQWDVPPATTGFEYELQRRSDPSFFATVSRGTATEAEVDRLPPGRHDFRVVSRDGAGNEVTSDLVSREIPFSGDFVLLGPYPNPAASEAVFDVTSERTGSIEIDVYDTLGRRVETQEAVVQEDRSEVIRVQTDRLSSGLYFVQFRGPTFTTTRRLMVAR